MENVASIMADISRLMRRAFDARARAIGVTRAQWQVLTVLKRHEGVNQGGLAELLDVEGPQHHVVAGEEGGVAGLAPEIGGEGGFFHLCLLRCLR